MSALLDMVSRKHANPGKLDDRKPLEWILIDSLIIAVIAMGAVMPSAIPTMNECWVMFKAFLIAFILQLAVERGLKKKS